MPDIELLDANVLISMPLCDTMLRLAERDVYRPRWSAEILDEVRRHPLGNATPEKLEHRIDQMNTAFPGAEVTGYQDLTDQMTNDPKDRHVLAAAVHSGATKIVTANVADFPPESTAPYGIEVVRPDDFLLRVWQDDPQLMTEVIKQQAAEARNPRMTPQQVLTSLENAGAPRFAAAMRPSLAVSQDQAQTQPGPAPQTGLGPGIAKAASAFRGTTQQAMPQPGQDLGAKDPPANQPPNPVRDVNDRQR